MELAPHPGTAPLGEPPVCGWPGRAKAWRELAPRAAGRGHEHDGRQHFAVPVPASAAPLRPYWRSRDHPLEQLPQPVRHKPLHHRHHARQLSDQAS